MPPTELAATLRQSTTEVLETMCFLSIAESEENRTQESGDWLTSTLSFQGGRNGKFGVSAPYEVARVMAANLLGEELEDVDREKSSDCLSEIANMICGGFVHCIEKEAVFELSHPQSEFSLIQPGSTATVECLQLDNGPVSVWAEME
jgi:CheY-specific phosphatase CheX